MLMKLCVTFTAGCSPPLSTFLRRKAWRDSTCKPSFFFFFFFLNSTTTLLSPTLYTTSDLSRLLFRQRPGSSRAGRGSLPVVLQPAGSLHQHVRRGRERKSVIPPVTMATVTYTSQRLPLAPALARLTSLRPAVCVCVCVAVQSGLGCQELHQVRDGSKLDFCCCGCFEPAAFLRGNQVCVPPTPQIAVSVLTYPFMLAADVMAVNNCG